MLQSTEQASPVVDIVDQAIAATYGRNGLTKLDQLSEEHPDWSLEERIKRLGEQVVNTQTNFFREPNVRSIASKLFPLLLWGKPGQTVRILEVGCSSGEESYSLASAILSEGYTAFEIAATDVNPQCLEFARKAEYELAESLERFTESSWRMPPELVKAGYFEATGKTWQRGRWTEPLVIIRPSDEVKQKITFAQHDIINGPYDKDHDLAVVNNVLMHYPDATRDAIMKNVKKSLRPGGFIALEGQLIGMDRAERTWLEPYNNWRQSLAQRHELQPVQPSGTFRSSEPYYRI